MCQEQARTPRCPFAKSFLRERASFSPLSRSLFLLLCAFLSLPCFGSLQALERVLQNNSLITDISDAKGSSRLYRIDLPPSRKELTIQTYGGGGDVDIYLRYGAPPGVSWDARSIASGTQEYIRVSNPSTGSYYFTLYGAAAYTNVTLSVLYSGSTAAAQVGDEVWSFDAATHIFSAPSVAPDGTIYAAGKSGQLPPSLYALNSDGTFKSALRFDLELYSSPVLGKDGTIYLTGEDTLDNNAGRLLAISPDQSIKWQFPRVTQSRLPAALGYDQTLYIPSDKNTLLAVTPNGAFKWEFTAFSGSKGVASPIIAPNGTIYCSFYNTALARGKIYALTPTGTNLWEYETLGPARSLALDAAGGIVFGIADGTSAVYAIDSAGRFRWKADLRQQAYVVSPPVIAQDGTIYVSTSRTLIALHSTGAEKWRHPSSETSLETTFANAPVLGANGAIYYATSGSNGQGTLYAVSSTGAQLWRRPLASQVRAPIVLTPTGNLIFGAPDRNGQLLSVRAGSPLASSIWPVARQNLSNTGALPPPPGAIQVSILPAGAVTAGAQWQIDGGAFQNSGATVAGVAPGSYTIAFKPISGWTAPANLTITVPAGQTATASGTYTQLTGSVRVSIAPQEAIAAGAQWQIDGGPLQNSGVTLSGIIPGTHTVAFKTIPGWTTPASQTVTINANETLVLGGSYVAIPQPGSLAANLYPSAAVSAGAQWQINDGPFLNSGAVVQGLSPGNYQVNFKSISGWTTPPSRSVAVVSGQIAVASAEYTPLTGSVRVTIAPQEAITAGAQWQLNGGAFQNSGVTLSGLNPGTYSISFKSLTGWTAPGSQSITISGTENFVLNGSYTALPRVGALTVNLSPPGALAAGAQWSLNNSPYQNSGSTLRDLPAGDHVLQFKPVNGWITPRSRVVTITAFQTNTVTVSYPQPPTIDIFSEPSGAIVARFTTTGGYDYTLQTTSSLSAPIQWQDLQTLQGTGWPLEVTLKAAPPAGSDGFTPSRVSPLHFYRIRVQ